MRFRDAYRKRKRMTWIGPWELDGDRIDYSNLAVLCAFGFTYMHQGSYLPILDPAPAKNSIAVTRQQAFILRRMLSKRYQLHRVVKPGWSVPPNDRRKWVWGRRFPLTKILATTVPGARGLLQKGLIEITIVGHPGYQYWCEPVMRRLVGVRGFVATGLRYLHQQANRKE